jgi:CYTH domain-containing protein
MEIERSYLVPKLPDNLGDFPKAEIRQGYLEITDGRETRVRQKNTEYFRTVKIGSGRIREETETKISASEFEILWSKTEGRRIEKTRHLIPYKNLKIDLDVYKEVLQGLITAEVEFENIAASDDFAPPDWFGLEVTDDSRYNNSSLAIHGLPTN